MKISNDRKRVLPALAGRIREFAEPVVRELEGIKPARAPDSHPDPQARTAASARAKTSPAAVATTLTGWSTKDLMAAVREVIKSGRAVARGRFLNIRI